MALPIASIPVLQVRWLSDLKQRHKLITSVISIGQRMRRLQKKSL